MRDAGMYKVCRYTDVPERWAKSLIDSGKVPDAQVAGNHGRRVSYIVAKCCNSKSQLNNNAIIDGTHFSESKISSFLTFFTKF